MAAGGVPVCLCGGSAQTIPAAEQHLPANLCPLIKSTYGYHVLRSNPFLEMADLVVGETTCDGKKKMYELMAEIAADVRPRTAAQGGRRRRPGVLGAGTGGVPRPSSAERFATEISDEQICGPRSAQLNRERALRRQLAALMKSDRPPLLGRQVLDCKSSIWAMPAALGTVRRTSFARPPTSQTGSAASQRRRTGARADDRRADGARGRAGAGHRRAERRAGRRHGKLHGPEAAAGRRRRGRRPIRCGPWPRNTSTCPAP